LKQRKPSLKQEGPAQKCLLCNNDYCDEHKSASVTLTCEINHETYCSKERHKVRHYPVCIFRNMEERESCTASNGHDQVAVIKEEVAEAMN